MLKFIIIIFITINIAMSFYMCINFIYVIFPVLIW